MKITDIDHIVLSVRDIETSANFYVSVLGMVRETFDRNRVALRFGRHKLNLHPCAGGFEPKAMQPQPGSLDLCFVTDTPLTDAMSHVQGKGVTIVDGPVRRSGACGPLKSFYFRDPDGNLIEVSNRAT
jgi:catechol 2,3-dioxygenase-like lactoylglutathione lyase family enzyme